MYIYEPECVTPPRIGGTQLCLCVTYIGLISLIVCLELKENDILVVKTYVSVQIEMTSS